MTIRGIQPADDKELKEIERQVLLEDIWAMLDKGVKVDTKSFKGWMDFVKGKGTQNVVLETNGHFVLLTAIGPDKKTAIYTSFAAALATSRESLARFLLEHPASLQQAQRTRTSRAVAGLLQSLQDH